MRHLLRGARQSRFNWLKQLLGWILLTAAVVTPLLVIVITSQQTQRREAGVQAQPPSYQRGGKRDPFKSPFDKPKEVPAPKVEETPLRARRPPGPAGLLVNDAQVAGVVEGLGGKIAMVAGDGSITYFLKEGDRLFDGYIRQISDGAVTFVREIKISSRVIDQQEIVKRVNPAP